MVICAPPHLHAPTAVAAFDAGLHVYLEKPLAPSLAEAEPAVQAWQRARTIGMIGFNFRFHPQIARIRERSAILIGDPLAVRAIFSILPHELPEWKRTRRTGGGVLLDLASHHVDLVHDLLGDEVTRVYASTRSLRGEHDHAGVQLELASGVIAQLFVSLGTVDENRLEIVGTDGKLVMDRTELLRPEHVPATQQGARARRLARALVALEPRRVLRSPGAEPSFAAALSAFVWSASGNAFAGPDLFDGVRNLAVIEAAERSLTSRAAEAPVARESRTDDSGTSRLALMRILLVNDYATPTAGAERDHAGPARRPARARARRARVRQPCAAHRGRVVRRRDLLRHELARADADVDRESVRRASAAASACASSRPTSCRCTCSSGSSRRRSSRCCAACRRSTGR